MCVPRRVLISRARALSSHSNVKAGLSFQGRVYMPNENRRRMAIRDYGWVLENDKRTLNLPQSALLNTNILAYRDLRVKSRNAWRWFSLTAANIPNEESQEGC